MSQQRNFPPAADETVADAQRGASASPNAAGSTPSDPSGAADDGDSDLRALIILLRGGNTISAGGAVLPPVAADPFNDESFRQRTGRIIARTMEASETERQRRVTR